MKHRTPKQRSAVTNGSRVHLSTVGGNSEEARRFRDLLAEAVIERGGEGAMSVAERQAARAWAGLAVQLELLHACQARGEAVDSEELGQLGDRMDRQARRMGRPKAQTTPTLREHIAARRGGAARQ